MIEQNRYIRLVFGLERDALYLKERMLEQNKPLRGIYGDEAFKRALLRADLLCGAAQELKHDLRQQGLV